MRSFAIIKPSRHEITRWFTDIDKTCLRREFLLPQMSFNAIHENEILAKISEFTVFKKLF